MKKQNVLITGSAGFIGFHLALRLKKEGYSVVGIDSFTSYYDVALKKRRAKILEEMGIETLPFDINRKEQLSATIEKNEISLLCHLAAQAGVRYSISHPEEVAEANLNGFLSILEACRKRPHIKLLFASSSSVYGTNSKVPFSEKDPTNSPANFYGATKKANELMAYSYHNLYKIPMIGLRFFTVYGPWGRPDMAYFSFAQKIQKNEPIELFNEGKMSRDFTYIDDIIDGIVQAINYDCPFEIFNLGNSHPENLETLIHCLEEGLSKKAIIKLLPKPIGEMESTFADISKSQKELGYSPKIPLKEGINKFIEWYKNYRGSCKTHFGGQIR